MSSNNAFDGQQRQQNNVFANCNGSTDVVNTIYETIDSELLAGFDSGLLALRNAEFRGHECHLLSLIDGLLGAARSEADTPDADADIDTIDIVDANDVNNAIVEQLTTELPTWFAQRHHSRIEGVNCENAPMHPNAVYTILDMQTDETVITSDGNLVRLVGLALLATADLLAKHSDEFQADSDSDSDDTTALPA